MDENLYFELWIWVGMLFLCTSLSIEPQFQRGTCFSRECRLWDWWYSGVQKSHQSQTVAQRRSVSQACQPKNKYSAYGDDDTLLTHTWCLSIVSFVVSNLSKNPIWTVFSDFSLALPISTWVVKACLWPSSVRHPILFLGLPSDIRMPLI
jgi:hypothetical protein